ncbi:MAG: DUF3267 domain-containing protein [Christensenellales bacterium]
MKLHYMGKYNLDVNSLPHGEHQEGAVRFKEPTDTAQLSKIATMLSFAILLVLSVIAVLRGRRLLIQHPFQIILGLLLPILTAFPHELLHAICFKGDVYLYTNWSQGLLFVVGPETMSKGRFVLMSLLPNLVFGIIPYIVGMSISNVFLMAFGSMATSMGAGDYYNVFNALTQMPKGARTYLYEFHSYWYLPPKHSS